MNALAVGGLVWAYLAFGLFFAIVISAEVEEHRPVRWWEVALLAAFAPVLAMLAIPCAVIVALALKARGALRRASGGAS